MHTLIIKYKFYCYGILVGESSHSVLYLSTDTLTENVVGILLKWGRDQTGKNSKFGKQCTERGFSEVIHDFCFFEHPWPSKMKFLPCSDDVFPLKFLAIR